MKYTITALILTAGLTGALAPAAGAGTPKRASSPIVITPPAIPDGSNRSRAPFLAERPQNDVTPPNAQAFDHNLPPNTPSTTPEPLAPPPAAVAILQPGVEPGVLPTGRAGLAASASLEPSRIQPAIQNAAYETREELIDSLRVRIRQSQEAVADMRRTRGQMSETGRSAFNAAYTTVQEQENALERSLRSAGRTSVEGWEAARERLAADYAAYANTLVNIDIAAGVTPAR